MSFVSFNDGLSAMVISSAGICLVHSTWTSDRGSAAAHLPASASSATCCVLGKGDSWLADVCLVSCFFGKNDTFNGRDVYPFRYLCTKVKAEWRPYIPLPISSKTSDLEVQKTELFLALKTSKYLKFVPKITKTRGIFKKDCLHIMVFEGF